MKKFTQHVYAAALAFIIMFSLEGCVKDSCTKEFTYTYYQPIYKTTAEVRANIKNNAPRNIERTGKIYIRDQYIFLNEVDKGIHVIDNSNPSAPQKLSFIDIPGNMDLAVKDNILYADMYTDLLALDISNPKQIAVKKIVENVFPYRYFGIGITGRDSSKILATWVTRDTTVRMSCENENGGIRLETNVFFADALSSSSGAKSASPIGTGGSMARFALVNQRLYTVGDADLNVFNISTAASPAFTTKKNLPWGVETIYPFKNNLFIGSNSGMYVFNINNPDNPSQTGQFSHVRSCDPVIADDNFAYVTLRSGSKCQGFTNQLEVLELTNNLNPTLLKTYPMTNPHGLSKDGSTLFICDGADGLKVYNASNPGSLKLISQLQGIDTYDVIAYNHIAIVVAKDGLYQYDYSNPANLRLLSKLTITN